MVGHPEMPVFVLDPAQIESFLGPSPYARAQPNRPLNALKNQIDWGNPGAMSAGRGDRRHHPPLPEPPYRHGRRRCPNKIAYDCLIKCSRMHKNLWEFVLNRRPSDMLAWRRKPPGTAILEAAEKLFSRTRFRRWSAICGEIGP